MSDAPAVGPDTDEVRSAAPALKDILELEEIDVNVFRGWSPAEPRWGRVYGGQTVSQALVSAQRTVDSSVFSIHSLHSYFLRAGDDDAAILYYVDALKDSGSFAARRVVAVQGGQPIFTCAISFAAREKVPLEHQTPMPDVPPAASLPLITTRMRALAEETRLPLRTRRMLARSAVQPIPFDIKWTDPADGDWRAWSSSPPLREASRAVWMRVRGRLPASPTAHHVALAYLSDWGIISTAGQPHGLTPFDPNVKPSSLCHSLYFHSPAFRADAWLLYSVRCERMAGSRALITGKVYTEAGEHVVTVVQEALVRVRDPAAAAGSPSPAIRRLLADPTTPVGAAVSASAGAGAGGDGGNVFAGSNLVIPAGGAGAGAGAGAAAAAGASQAPGMSPAVKSALGRLREAAADRADAKARAAATAAPATGDSPPNGKATAGAGAGAGTVADVAMDAGGTVFVPPPVAGLTSATSSGNATTAASSSSSADGAYTSTSTGLSSTGDGSIRREKYTPPLPAAFMQTASALPRDGPNAWDKPIIVALL